MRFLSRVAFALHLIWFIPALAQAQTAEDIQSFIEESLEQPHNILLLGPVEYDKVIVRQNEDSEAYVVTVKGISFSDGSPFGDANFQLEPNSSLAFKLRDGSYTLAEQTPFAVGDHRWSGVWSFQIPQRYMQLDWQAQDLQLGSMSAARLGIRVSDQTGVSAKKLRVQAQEFRSELIEDRALTATNMELSWDLTSDEFDLHQLFEAVVLLQTDPTLRDDLDRSQFLAERFRTLRAVVKSAKFKFDIKDLRLPLGEGWLELASLKADLKQDGTPQASEFGALSFDLASTEALLQYPDWAATLASLDFDAALVELKPGNLVPYLGELWASYRLSVDDLSRGDPAAAAALVKLFDGFSVKDSQINAQARTLRVEAREPMVNQLLIESISLISEQTNVNGNDGVQDIRYGVSGLRYNRATQERSSKLRLGRLEFRQFAKGLNLTASYAALMKLFQTQTGDEQNQASLLEIYDYYANFDLGGFGVEAKGFDLALLPSGEAYSFAEAGFGLALDGARADTAELNLSGHYKDISPLELDDPFLLAIAPTSLQFDKTIKLKDLAALRRLLSEAPRQNAFGTGPFAQKELGTLIDLVVSRAPAMFDGVQLNDFKASSSKVSTSLAGSFALHEDKDKVLDVDLDFELIGVKALREIAKVEAKKPGSASALFLAYTVPLLGYMRDPTGEGDWQIKIDLPEWGKLTFNKLPLPKRISSILFSDRVKSVLQDQLYQ